MEGANRLIEAAEEEWLEIWVAGPGERRSKLLDPGVSAPDLELLDHTGTPRQLSSFWSDGPALIMFWRHFGCGCGLDRASRLNEEYADYLAQLATAAELRVRTQTEVVSVKPLGAQGGSPLFSVELRGKPGGSEGHAARKPARPNETVVARYVVWAAGVGAA